MKKILLLILIVTNLNMYSQYNFSEVEKILNDSLNQIAGFGKGASLLLIKDGQKIFDKGFTLEGETEFNSAKMIPIASASKWLSGAVIIKLVDEGRLSLDDTIGKFFPNIAYPKSSISIRQLFSHTSGFPASEETACLGEKNITLDDCVNQLLELDLVYQPGQFFGYGGISMHIGGRIAEIASGIKMSSGLAWNQLFNDYIAEPCKMPNTRYGLNPVKETTNPRISGGVYSNAYEYANFLQMLINKGEFSGIRILSEKSVSELHKDQTNGAKLLFSPHSKYTYLSDGKTEYKYGIGNWREQSVIEPENEFESSSQGAFGFSPWIDYKRNMIGVLSVFSDLDQVMPTYIKVKKAVKDAVDKPSSVKEISKNKKSLGLQISPNPVVSNAEFSFYLPKQGDVSIKIYNILGNEIDTVVEKNLPEGEHKYNIDLSRHPSSIYICKFKYNEFMESSKFYISK